MKDVPLLTASAVLAAMLFAPSCRLFRKSPKAAPAPPPAAVPTETVPEPTHAEKPKQVTIPTPPEISPQHPDLTQPSPPQPEGKLPPPPRKRRSTRSARSRETTPEQTSEPAQPASAQAPTPEETALPVPQVEQIFTPEQRQTYLDEIEANIGRAQKVVDSVQGRGLTSEQKTDLARIREFIAQAKDAREADLFRARNLAERANILAQDLSRSLQ